MDTESESCKNAALTLIEHFVSAGAKRYDIRVGTGRTGPESERTHALHVYLSSVEKDRYGGFDTFEGFPVVWHVHSPRARSWP